MNIKFNIKGVIYGIIALVLVIGGFIFIPKIFTEQTNPVDYIMIQRNDIPEKILDIMGKYQDEKRALAVKIDGKVYIVATRGTDSEHGIKIEKVQTFNEDGKIVMKVNVIYKNKEKSHPYVVAETNLKDLPDRIELNSKVSE